MIENCNGIKTCNVEISYTQSNTSGWRSFPSTNWNDRKLHWKSIKYWQTDWLSSLRWSFGFILRKSHTLIFINPALNVVEKVLKVTFQMAKKLVNITFNLLAWIWHMDYSDSVNWNRRRTTLKTCAHPNRNLKVFRI